MATLEDLIRQRQLMASHLAWLDNEIAAQRGQGVLTQLPSATAHGSRAPGASPFPAAALRHPQPLTEITHTHAKLSLPGHTPPRTMELPPELQSDPVTKELIENYASQANHSPQDARRGCLTLFFVVLGGLLVTVLSIWLLKYR